MAVTAKDGHGNLMRRMWEGERDDDGHRTWTVSHQVTATSFLDGPAVVMQCADLPQIGDQWNFGNDVDVWAWCWPSMKVKYLSGPRPGEPSYYWEVEQKFTTKPMHRCNVTQIANPLSEPFQLSGSFVKYTREVGYDMFGNAIRSSSHEQVHGPGVEFDFNKMTVKVAWNVATLDLPAVSTFVDTVNDSTLWGMGRRCVKLSNYTWERVLYGVCTFYVKQSLEFDVDWNTFDRNLLDEGYKCLHGEWAKDASDPNLTTYRGGVPLPLGSLWKLLPVNGGPPNRSNPQHFTRYKDKNGEMGRVVLDGNGEPCSEADPGATWLPSHRYKFGSFVINRGSSPGTSSGIYPGNVYLCTSSGTSQTSGGPTGTGSVITDGTCVWKYLYPASNLGGSVPGNVPVSYYPQSNMLLLGIPSSLST